MQKVPISCVRKIKDLEEQADHFAKQINGLLPLWSCTCALRVIQMELSGAGRVV